MSVISVYQLWAGRRGGDSITRHRTYTLTFHVRTNNPFDDANIVGGEAGLFGLPRNGDPYPFDFFALMIGIRAEQDDNDPTLWTVYCDYDTQLPFANAMTARGFDPATGNGGDSFSGAEPADVPENPLDRDPAYSITYEKFEEPARFDVFDNPILNCADDFYDPPPMRVRSTTVVNITKNLAVASFSVFDNFIDSVNLTKWMGRNPRCCRIDNISYESASENGVNFWRTQFRVVINPETWDLKVEERGYRGKISDGTGGWKLVAIPLDKDSTGRVIDRPALLDNVRDPPNAEGYNLQMNPSGSGSDPTAIPNATYPILADGTTGRGYLLGSGQSPRFSRWRVCKEVEFRLLGI